MSLSKCGSISPGFGTMCMAQAASAGCCCYQSTTDTTIKRLNEIALKRTEWELTFLKQKSTVCGASNAMHCQDIDAACAATKKNVLPKSYQSWLGSRHTHDQQLFAAELTVTAEETFESLSGRQWLLGLKRGAQNVQSTSSSSSSSWLSSSNSLSNQKCYSNNVE